MEEMQKMMNLFDEYIICEECEREIVNKKLKTKHGCMWCDFLYWRNN